jgi:hypothetical protein
MYIKYQKLNMKIKKLYFSFIVSCVNSKIKIMNDTKIMIATFGLVVTFMGVLFWLWTLKAGV